MKKGVWVILVPTAGNDGKRYAVSYHRLWDAKVREITGGLTICKTTRGYWTSPDGKLFREKMIPVQLVCTAKQIEIIADMTAEHYNQLAILFYKISDEVRIKHYEKQASKTNTRSL